MDSMADPLFSSYSVTMLITLSFTFASIYIVLYEQANKFRLACFAWMATAWQTTLKLIKAFETEWMVTLQVDGVLVVVGRWSQKYRVVEKNKAWLDSPEQFLVDSDQVHP